MIIPMQVALGFSISAVLISLSNLIYTCIHGQVKKTNNLLFIAMLFILMINASCGIVSSLVDGYRQTSDTAYFIQRVSRYIYFITHTALCPLLYFYTSSVVGQSIRENVKKTLLLATPFFITEILVISNPLTYISWHFDEFREFHRGIGELGVYLAAAFYYIMTIVLILFSWRTLSKKRKTVLLWCFGTVLLGILIQLFVKTLRVEVLFETIGVTGILMCIENEDDRTNAVIGTYNRQALSMDLEAAFANYKQLYFDVVRVTNSDIISRLTCSGNADLIYAQIAAYLKTVVPEYSVYAANPGVFVLVLYHKNEDEVNEIVSTIEHRFADTWDSGEISVPISIVQMIGNLPNHITSISEAFYMMDAPLPVELDKNVLKDDDLDYLLRRVAVEGAVSRGLEEGSFEVYYQPTYHIDETLHGAEALLRMHDSILGDVYPDEFIPAAESMGMIDKIDEYVLKEVCDFVKTGIPKQHGMDSINVNLSVIQCMKTGFVERVLEIVDGAGVKRSFINFEITESVAATDYKLLKDVVKKLKSLGFMFSMDDYGTGYSNINSAFSLNFDVVKIDKSILWEAEKSRMGSVVLENSIRMMKEMDKEILVEGVETETQVKLLKELKVDYLQGFYYSRPVPKDDFIELIS